ncbi:MAG: hypothetical protein V4584_06135 [Verrucomicrobiota bacterium]
MSESPAIRRAIAESLLGSPLDELGFAPCPGRHLHNGASGRRDFQVMLEGAPTARCFHTSCGAVVDEFNGKLRSMIGKAEANGGGTGAPRPPMLGNVPPMPEAPRKPKRPPYDPGKLADFAARCPYPITPEWLAARSPVAIPETQGLATAELFLASLYHPGERVLAFVAEFSQGDFLWTPGGGSYRLAERPGVKAVPSPLPTGGPLGCWFLAQPVSGKWEVNTNNRAPDGSPKMGRRHGACVTAWRFMVLESDEAPPELWLRALVQLPLPIVAVYTSGGRSIHALARVDAGSKESWDALRDDLVPILAPIGADPAAMTAVRLTRLPGTLRHGSRGKDGKVKPYPSPCLQRLLWLNPRAPARPILDLLP